LRFKGVDFIQLLFPHRFGAECFCLTLLKPCYSAFASLRRIAKLLFENLTGGKPWELYPAHAVVCLAVKSRELPLCRYVPLAVLINVYAAPSGIAALAAVLNFEIV
jgi:hypothetical protein